MPESDLQKYFMDQTNQALSDLKTDVALISAKLDDLGKFRAALTAESKLGASFRSLLISGISGVITLGVSLGVSIWLGHQERDAIIEAARIEVAHSLKLGKAEK